MILLTAQDVVEFQELYLRQTGRKLSPARARHVAECLVELVERIHELGADSEPFPYPSA